MSISFSPFQEEHIPLWLSWVERPHIKNIWFLEDHEAADIIDEKVTGNGYDYPHLIYIDQIPIGYIVCRDLFAYKNFCIAPQGVFANEAQGTFSLDLFIGEESLTGQGFGVEIVKQFIDFVIHSFNAKKILISPDIANKRAIRCYEKAGFQYQGIVNDGVVDCYIMEYKRRDV